MAWQKIGKTTRPPIANIKICGAPSVPILLDNNSYAWAWGQNNVGALGDNTIISKSSPISVLGNKQWSVISGGFTYVFCAGLDGNSYAWAWGQNTYGALGQNNTTNRSSPVSVLGGRQFSSITGSGNIVLAIDLSGYMWAWGNNASGQLGDGTITHRSSPVSVLGAKLWSVLPPSIGNDNLAVALDINGYAWAWGTNGSGQIGDNTLISKSSPTSVVGGKRFWKLATTCNTIALDLSSYAWAWGLNNAGTMGDGTGNHRSSPVSVLGGVQFIDLHSGSGIAGTPTAFGLDGNYNVWAWGANSSGQFGNNSIMGISVPINTDNKFTKIYYGNAFAIGLDANGYAWSWGSCGSYGYLGQNTNISRSVPAYVWRINKVQNILGRGIR